MTMQEQLEHLVNLAKEVQELYVKFSKKHDEVSNATNMTVYKALALNMLDLIEHNRLEELNI